MNDSAWEKAKKELDSGVRDEDLWATLVLEHPDLRAAKLAYLSRRAREIDRREVGESSVSTLRHHRAEAVRASSKDGSVPLALSMLVLGLGLALVAVYMVIGNSDGAPANSSVSMQPSAVLEPAAAASPPMATRSSEGDKATVELLLPTIAETARHLRQQDAVSGAKDMPSHVCAVDLASTNALVVERGPFGDDCGNPTGPITLRLLSSETTSVGTRYRLLSTDPRNACGANRRQWICEVSAAGDVIEIERQSPQ